MTNLRTALAALLLAILPLAAVTGSPLLGQDAGRAPDRSAAVEPAAPVTVFAVRHAEKAKDDPRDPGLTEAGQTRARDLARTLSAAGVTHLFSTNYRRTRATLAPLAEATGLEVVLYDPRNPARLMETLHALPPGSRAVVSGHSNTTPAVVRALGGSLEGLVRAQGMELLAEHEYDRLFVVTLGDEERATSAVELRYGAASVVLGE